MTVARIYIMHAKPGEDAVLETALRELAVIVPDVPGSEGFELLRDLGNELRFIIIEKWDSEESHKGSISSLPEDLLGRVMGAVDGPLDGSYYDYLVG